MTALHRTTAPRWASWLLARLNALTLAYITFLGLWFAVRVLFGDRWWWLFGLNSFAVFLFVPLPLALLAALLGRRPPVVLAVSGATALLLWLYGDLWLPPWPAAEPAGPRLRVMTYNIYGFIGQPERVVATIRQSRADIVTIQELNPAAAVHIARDLSGLYPYQALEPQEGAYGMGVISKLPLRPSAARLPGESWRSPPQLLTVDVSGRPVTLVHVHPQATLPSSPSYMEETLRIRQLQVAELLELLAGLQGPVLMPVDLNSTDQSVSYAMIRQVMGDAWRAVGWGFGHTFPSSAPSGESADMPLALPWLVRIDYVFYSHHWQPLSAEIGPWDGVSDHRPVIADLVLEQKSGVRSQDSGAAWLWSAEDLSR